MLGLFDAGSPRSGYSADEGHRGEVAARVAAHFAAGGGSLEADLHDRQVMAGTCPPRRAVVGQLTVAFRLFTSTAPTLPKAASTLLRGPIV